MPATYTVDLFSSLDGYGSYRPPGDWGGYWGQQGPELLAARERLLAGTTHVVLGARTFAQFARFAGMERDGELPPGDAWSQAMRALPTHVVTSTLADDLGWPSARLERRSAVDVVSRLKRELDGAILSHGSPTLNGALLRADLVDVLQVTVFPVVTAETGDVPVLAAAGDLDLELLDATTLDGRTQVLRYRPHPRRRR